MWLWLWAEIFVDDKQVVVVLGHSHDILVCSQLLLQHVYKLWQLKQLLEDIVFLVLRKFVLYGMMGLDEYFLYRYTNICEVFQSRHVDAFLTVLYKRQS